MAALPAAAAPRPSVHVVVWKIAMGTIDVAMETIDVSVETVGSELMVVWRERVAVVAGDGGVVGVVVPRQPSSSSHAIRQGAWCGAVR